MDRSCIFVDAGYLFAAGGLLCHQTTARSKLVLQSGDFIEHLCAVVEAHDRLPSLRTYWYDGAKLGVPTQSQSRIASLPGVKLRLGRLNSQNQQKGVDALIYRDLITLATERAITDAYLLSGDEDLREGVKAVQDRGVRVVLLGIPAQSGFNQSKELCNEVDDQIALAQTDLARFLHLDSQPSPTTAIPAPGPQPASPPLDADVRVAARAFAESWKDEATEEQVRELIAAKPRIPKPVDVELLRNVEMALSSSLRDLDASKRVARKAFWSVL